MASPLSVHDVSDVDFQRQEWRFQRVGWLLLTAALVAALAGLLGPGPLSETTTLSSDETVEVEYDRFIRHLGDTTMTVTLGPDTVENGKAQLYISRDLLEGWRLSNVSPTPSTESSSAEWLIYEFDVLGNSPPRVKLVYKGDGLGVHDGVIRAGNGAPAEIQQLIYP